MSFSKRIARRIKISRIALDKLFDDPKHRMMYDKGRAIWESELKKREFEIQENLRMRENPKGRQHSHLGKEIVLPDGNASLVTSGLFGNFPDYAITEEGKPRPHVHPMPMDEDNLKVHSYMDTWQSLADPWRIRKEYAGRGEPWEAFVYYGFDSKDPTPRIIHIGERPRNSGWMEETALPGFPEPGSSVEDFLDWLGEYQGYRNQIYMTMPGSSHLPPYADMTPEMRKEVDNYNPWKTSLNPNQIYLLKSRTTYLRKDNSLLPGKGFNWHK